MPGRPHHSDKMRSCVDALIAKGTAEGSAYAICTSSLQKAGTPIFAEESTVENQPRYVHLIGATGAVRTGSYSGREHIVVPVIALMEGVIHAVNAATPELVPIAALSVAPQGWNGRPLMLGHPTRDGHQISANDPKVLEERCFGNVFNARLEGKKLTMEAWIDPERVVKIGGQQMLDRIRAGQMIEVSVGAFVTTENGEGEYNGKRYIGTWKDIVPDHLAFLENKKGACSIEMGCGSSRYAELVTAENYEQLDEAKIIELLGAESHVETLAGDAPGHDFHGNQYTVTRESSKLIGNGNDQYTSTAANEHQKTVENAIGQSFHPDTQKTIGQQTSVFTRVQGRAKDRALIGEKLTSQGYVRHQGHTKSEDVYGRPDMKSIVSVRKQGKDLVVQHIRAAEESTLKLEDLKYGADAVRALVDVTLRAAGYYDTPAQADSEEAAELVTYETMRALLDQAEAAYTELSDLVDALIAAEKNEVAATPDEEAAETELEQAQLESIKTLCMAMYGALSAVMSCCSDQLAPESDQSPVPRYMARHTKGQTSEFVAALRAKMTDCAMCDGSGSKDGNPCPACDGTGQLRVARDISQKQREKLPTADFAGPGTSFPIAKPEDVAAAVHSIGRAKGDPNVIKAHIIEIAYRKGASFVAQLPEDWKRKVDQRSAEVGEQTTCKCGQLRAACRCQEKKSMTKEDRAEVIKSLVANKHSGFTAGDEAILEAASDDRLESFRVASESRAAEVKAAQDAAAKPRQLTEEEFMKVAPPEVTSMVTRMRNAETSRKAQLVTALKTSQTEYSESELSTMKLEDLERMVRFAKVAVEEQEYDFSGRAIPRAAAANSHENDVFLNPPDPYAPALAELAGKK